MRFVLFVSSSFHGLDALVTSRDVSCRLSRLEGVMREDSKVMDIIVEELTEAKDKHAVPRRTLIKPDEGEKSPHHLLNVTGHGITVPEPELFFVWYILQ